MLAYGAVYEAAMDAAFRAAEANGIRAILGKVMMDRGTYDPIIEPSTILDRSLRESADLIERWHGADDGRLGYAVTPRFAISCTPRCCANRRPSRRRPARGGRRTSRGPFEIARWRASIPDADYVDVYDRAGGLGARTVLAHAVHLSDRELARLVESGTHVAHCPASNLFIGAGVMPLAPVPRGRAVGRARLGRVGRPGASIFSVMRVGAYAQMARRSLAGDEARVLGPLDWLRLGTLEGARRSGSDDGIGSLEAGKEADMIAVDPAFVAPLAGRRRTTIRSDLDRAG